MANGASRGGRRRRRKPNKSGIIMNRLELVIFGAIIIYIFVLIYRYINTKPIKGYEIQMGSLSVSKTYTGIALRQEEILKTQVIFAIMKGRGRACRQGILFILLMQAGVWQIC